jgi:hypothetical protein
MADERFPARDARGLDLGLTLLGLSAPEPADEATVRGPALVLMVMGTLARVALAPAVLVIAGIRFDALSRERAASWGDVARVARRRLLPALAAWLLAAGLGLALSLVAQTGALLAFKTGNQDFESVRVVSVVVQRFVFIVVLVRFAFVPFVVALSDFGHWRPAQSGKSIVRALAYRIGWPLIASSAMTRDVRWRVLPYLVLGIYAPAAAGLAPPVLRAVASFALHLLSFTALAAMFGHYDERRRSLPAADGGSAPSPAREASSPGTW